MKQVYIVLYSEGTLDLYANKVNYSNFEKGTEIFTAPDNLPLINICKWIGNNHEHTEIKKMKK